MIGLINLYKLNAKAEGYYHVEKLGGFRTICDLPKLKHFGLIEKGENLDKTKKTAGTWKITRLGIDFVLEKTPIPAAVFLYLDTVRRKSSTEIYIRQAIKKKFDYDELMNGDMT